MKHPVIKLIDLNPNLHYYYEQSEINLLINHPQFQPDDPGVKWLSAAESFDDRDSQNAIRDLQEGEKLLLPFNHVSRVHTNGVVLEKKDGKLQITWLDSAMKYHLEERQRKFLAELTKVGVSFNPSIMNKPVDQQSDSASCGPRTMDNLIRIAKGLEPLKYQDSVLIRKNHMHFIDSDNFNRYQSFHSNAWYKAHDAKIPEKKEFYRLRFIGEAIAKIESFKAQMETAMMGARRAVVTPSPETTIESSSRSESPNSISNQENSSRSMTPPIYKNEHVVYEPKYAPEIKFPGADKISIEQLEKVSLEAPLVNMALKIENEGSKTLQNNLSAWSKIHSEEERQHAWATMITNAIGRDKELLKELESEGYNYNPDSVEKINKRIEKDVGRMKKTQQNESILKFISEKQVKRFAEFATGVDSQDSFLQAVPGQTPLRKSLHKRER